jgi:hypothetical protein
MSRVASVTGALGGQRARQKAAAKSERAVADGQAGSSCNKADEH